MNNNGIGLYIHVPFCESKCPYCDFYSICGDEDIKEAYVRSLAERFSLWGERLKAENRSIKTIYFGGGTPNLLGAKRLAFLISEAARVFSVHPDVEITVEANPTHVDYEFFSTLRSVGANRLSMGLQSANAEELEFLGRKHTARDVVRAVSAARKAGFENCSLDLMLCLPNGNEEKLGKSIDFAADLGAEHISSYILKVEEGTPFALQKVQLPSDDREAQLYLFAVQKLKERGYAQYEISNFSKLNMESRHNLLYWQGEEYLGFGPAAHSFFCGERFFYPRDLNTFLAGCEAEADGKGGSFGEYAMLNLRLSRGLRRKECAGRFVGGAALFDEVLENTKNCPPLLLEADSEKISFTPEGFLVSNALLLRLLPNSL